MNKAEYLDQGDVKEFLEFFGRCLHFLEVDYTTSFNKIRPADRHFHVTGANAACLHYAWPSVDTYTGHPIYDWTGTLQFLNTTRIVLQHSIAIGDDFATWNTVEKILRWGLNPNAVAANLIQLRQICPAGGQSICTYLVNISAALALNTANTSNINAALIPFASSGMSKVHSLASADALVIFDSRVAATLGECINEYLRRVRAVNIPDSLKIFRATGRSPLPLQNGTNHPLFVRNHLWIECQVRVSWLFEAALTKNQNIFPGLSMPERMHRLEAAFFMKGAYLTPGPFAGRSFNFERV